MRRPSVFLLAVLAVCAGSAVARAQADRLGRFEPGLIVESGGRMGACDVITFTPDGKFVLAVGDDKVVRVWKHGAPGLEPRSEALRWSIFRDQRGNIYSLAVSPDEDSRYLAIGGTGVQVAAGSLVVLDRTTGEVKKALAETQRNTYAVWSVAFSPSGKRIAYGKGDGQVGVWNWESAQANDVVRLGSHPPRPGYPLSNKVRLVAFLDEDRLVSLAEDGQLLQWDLAKPGAAPVKLHQFGSNHVWQARLSPDRQWVGAVSQDRRAARKVEAYSIAKRHAVNVPLTAYEYPHSLAFDTKGQRLAVGTWVPPNLDRPSPTRGTGGAVLLYDLRADPPAMTYGPRHAYYIDALAFDPTGTRLVLAGGVDHDVTLWDLRKLGGQPLSRMVGVGRCLWGVGLSADGRYLGYQDQVDVAADSVNRRGKGPWRVFDLQKRGWAAPGLDFAPVKPLESAGGWKLAEITDVLTWHVIAPDGKSYPLPWDFNYLGYPRCYTFLPGKTPRLAVGHFWGASLFELTKAGPVRTRWLSGHNGEVMAIAPSADYRLLVTAGRDQTVATWGLDTWPSEPELGARCFVRQGKLLVDAVDAGSPAWEMGLTKDDEVTLLAFDGKLVPGGADAWLARLRQPVPGKELYFEINRPGAVKPIRALTTVRQRPLWRFFPTRENEWVLWRWRDYYYDSSTNGDQYIGWQVSGDVDVTPAFYKAEQFRQQFYRPDKVAAMLAALHGWEHQALLLIGGGAAQATSGQLELPAPERVSIPDIEPPEVRLTAQPREVKDADLTVTLSAVARGKQANHQLDRVLFWINDFQFAAERVAGTTYEKTLVIPRDRLRRGPNVLRFQCYNRGESRGEAPPVVVECIRPASPPRLFGLLVGIGDYRQTKQRVAPLNADRDAEALQEVWQEQKGKFYAEVNLQTLLNRKATPQALLKHLEALIPQVKPDDQLIIFLGGHGTSSEELVKLVNGIQRREKKPVAFNPLPPRSFAFVGPAFDALKPADTCVTSQDLYQAIARLPCHKLVLLDTCHSGAFTVNPVRELTRDGVGPVILTACKPHEQAIEFGLLDNNQAYGLFTMAVRRALLDEFDEADSNRDGQLTMAELARFLQERVPRYVQQIKDYKVAGIKATDSQVPDVFLPQLEEKAPVARK